MKKIFFFFGGGDNAGFWYLHTAQQIFHETVETSKTSVLFIAGFYVKRTCNDDF